MLRVVATAVVVAMTVILVTPGRSAATTDEPPTLWGSIRYSERGPGATYDGIANTFIMSSYAPVMATRAAGAMQLVVELLQNPAVAEAIGTDMGSVTDEIRRTLPAAKPPIKASYDALISFQLEAGRDGKTYRLKSGTISWSTRNFTRLSAGDITMVDDFQGSGTEELDPATDVIDLTFEPRDDGSIGWTLNVDVTHTYLTDGTSSWTTPIATISMVKTGPKLEVSGTTAVGPVPIPPMPEDLLADMTKTVGYVATGTVPLIGDQILHREIWTNIVEGTQMVTLEVRGDCSPVIVRPDPPRLVFDEANPAAIRDTAVLQGLLSVEQGAQWQFPDVPFDTEYEPGDMQGPRLDFTWRGLPKRNEDFGEYAIEVEYTDPAIAGMCGPVRPLYVDVFFPIAAKNNPDGDVPNWFYYWMQTSARNGISDVEVVECATREAGEYETGDKLVKLCDPQTYQPQVRMADGAPIAYIDGFAVTLIHEDRHRRNFREWWTNPDAYDGLWEHCVDLDHDGRDEQRPECKMDTDRDLIPDAVEPLQTAPDGHNLGLVVGSKYSCVLDYVFEELGDKAPQALVSAGIDDEECTAYWEETRWEVGAARTEDWASPGSQWGDR